MTQVDFQLTEADCLALALERQHEHGTWRNFLRRTFLLPTGIFLLAAFMTWVLNFFLNDLAAPTFMNWFLAALALGLSPLHWLRWRSSHVRQMKKWLRRGDARDALSPQSAAISAAGLTWTGRSGQSHYAWHAFMQIKRLESFLEFIVGESGGLVIPCRAFKSPQECEQFFAAAQAFRAAAPPAELVCPKCRFDLRGATTDRCPECGWRRDGVASN